MKFNRPLVLPLVSLLAIVIALTPFILFRPDGSIVPETLSPTTAETPRSTETPHYTASEVIGGLENPWDVAFTPNGAMLITERSGRVSKVVNGEARLITKISDVYARGEGGLMGMTVDPSYDTNRFIYVCFNTTFDIRVVRLELDEDQTSVTSRQDIITGMPVNRTVSPGRHSGCRPRFGPDGYLWVGTGDVANGTNPQDPNSLGGKVLRVDRAGIAAPDNLPPPFDARIYSYGHRNIQGMAFFAEETDGVIGYSIEHGSGRDDEVNELVKGNFGWNPVPGYNESVAMTDKQKYPDAIAAVWSSEAPTIAPSGGTILMGSKWKAWEGALAMAVLKDRHVRILLFEDRKLSKEVPILGAQYGRIRSAVMGPDQDLYITTDNGEDDKVVRVTPR